MKEIKQEIHEIIDHFEDKETLEKIKELLVDITNINGYKFIETIKSSIAREMDARLSIYPSRNNISLAFKLSIQQFPDELFDYLPKKKKFRVLIHTSEENLAQLFNANTKQFLSAQLTEKWFVDDIKKDPMWGEGSMKIELFSKFEISLQTKEQISQSADLSKINIINLYKVFHPIMLQD